MVLVDCTYLNSDGGKTILHQIINHIIEKKISDRFFFLIDFRIPSKEIKLNKNYVKYIKPSEFKRRSFYLNNNQKFQSFLCMSNVPPPIFINKNVYIYFHNDLLIRPFKTNLSLFYKTLNFIKKQYIKLINKENYLWIVQTQSVKNNISHSFRIKSKKIKILPIFDSSEGFISKEKLNNTFLYVSNYSNHKNHERLLKAFIKSANKIKKIISLNLTIHEEDYKNSVYKLSSLPKNLSIKNHGILNKKDLNKLYSESEFLIFPSLNESFGLPLIESINFKCKVIASDLKYVHDIISPSLLFDPKSDESISKSIIYAIKNDNIKESKLLVENKIDTFVKNILINV
jgi:glycosyltransferase involved in cell wall biosynthesis